MKHLFRVPVLLALAVGIWPRRPTLAQMAACGAAVLIALQLGLDYWFFLYVVWFFPLVMLALLAPPPGRPTAPEPPRSTEPEAVPVHTG
jgi:hypothetical protein